MKNIPAASDGKHLGFAWGPGDILVYETVHKVSGMCWQCHKSFTFSCFMLWPSRLHAFTTLLCPALWFQVLQDLVAPSSMRSERMRIYIPLFYASSSMSRITSLLACKLLGRTFPARTKNHSKSSQPTFTLEDGDVNWTKWKYNTCRNHCKMIINIIIWQTCFCFPS